MNLPTQYCTFYLHGQHFGVDVLEVQEILRYQEMTRVPLADDAVTGLINLRGQIVTAIDLRERIGLPDREEGGKLPTNVVLQSEQGAVSFLVDEIGDVVEVAEASYEPPPDTMQPGLRDLVTGVFKLDDHLLLILDTNAAAELDTRRTVEA
jgi:purine-binding chemotaxis protein CheW